MDLIESKPKDKLAKWFILSKIFYLPRRLITAFLAHFYLVIISYQDSHRAPVFDLVRKIKKETEMLMFYNEGYQIYAAVKATEKIKGDLAEVGTYKGASTKIICEAKANRVLHAFDTFKGLPEVRPVDGWLKEGQFSGSFKQLKKYLQPYPNVLLYKGRFPLTAGPIKNKTFSFVNLDVDIYESTLDCLKFFYPRMSQGGVIISHDYAIAGGVKKAFDEFFKNKPEVVIELPATQCLIVKLK